MILKSFFIIAVCLSLTYSIALTRHQLVNEWKYSEILHHEVSLHDQIPLDDGYTNIPISQANLEIDNYIRTQIPELQTATLIAAENQQMNGVNYIYTYNTGSTLYSVLVWDQPSNKSRQIQGITRVDTSMNSLGQIIRNTTITKLSSLSLQQEANKLFP
jgi:hypothetical protein